MTNYELQSHIDKLIFFIESSGFKVRFNKGSAGYTDVFNRQVTVRPDRNLVKVLFILAHEYRHVQHHKLGIYKDYYRADNRKMLNYVFRERPIPTHFKLPSLSLGVRAERDCDRFADDYLKQLGLYYKHEVYKSEWTYIHPIIEWDKFNRGH